MSDQDSSGSDDLSLQDSDPSSVVSVVGRPRRSPVWDHFIYDSTTNKSTCQVLCGNGSEVYGHAIGGKYPYNYNIL